MNLDYVTVIELGYVSNATFRQMCVCTLSYTHTHTHTHMCLHSGPYIHVNMSNLSQEHYCFLPYTFPKIPPATDVGLNYYLSIWLLIIQREKKSWPCDSNWPRANSTECVTRPQNSILYKNFRWNSHIPCFTCYKHKHSLKVLCNTCVSACATCVCTSLQQRESPNRQINSKKLEQSRQSVRKLLSFSWRRRYKH